MFDADDRINLLESRRKVFEGCGTLLLLQRSLTANGTPFIYIVFFSNIFAILGLRSMFFLLINIIDKFHYLKIGLALLLTFIGLKMLAANYIDRIGLTTGNSLLIILAILVTSIAASLMFPKGKEVKN